MSWRLLTARRPMAAQHSVSCPRHMTSLLDFESALQVLDPQSDDFVLAVAELLGRVPESLREETIPSIFSFFEKHPLEDMGAPGSLVHFVEHSYPRYKEVLLASVRERPSYNAILMINRILNSQLTAAERHEYLSSLRAVVASPTCPKPLVSEARHFIDYQSGRGS